MATHGQQFKIPKEGSYIEFEKYNTKVKCPFVVYGDFECITVNSNNGIKGTYQEHKPCGYMLNVVNSIDNTSQPYLYRGEDCLDHFVNKLREVKKDIFDKMNVNKPMDITDEQEAEFRKATDVQYVIRILNQKIQKSETTVILLVSIEVVLTKNVIWIIHLDISRYQYFFHNLKNHDSHLIIGKANEINKELNENKRIDVIAQNSEKFITFSFGSLQFKDSMAFLSASLDKLVKLNKYDIVGKDEHDKPIYKKRNDWKDNFRFSSANPYIRNKTDLDFLTEKGVYPYDYMNSFDKFNESQLPSIEDFYSKLYEEGITDTQHTRAKVIWDNFNIKNLGEYHDLYLMTDVYLLSDVFENFRDMC